GKGEPQQWPAGAPTPPKKKKIPRPNHAADADRHGSYHADRRARLDWGDVHRGTHGWARGSISKGRCIAGFPTRNACGVTHPFMAQLPARQKTAFGNRRG